MGTRRAVGGCRRFIQWGSWLAVSVPVFLRAKPASAQREGCALERFAPLPLVMLQESDGCAVETE